MSIYTLRELENPCYCEDLNDCDWNNVVRRALIPVPDNARIGAPSAKAFIRMLDYLEDRDPEHYYVEADPESRWFVLRCKSDNAIIAGLIDTDRTEIYNGGSLHD